MSLTTTKKFEQFQSTPLRDCVLKDVPGVGEVAENKLKEANIDNAEKIIGHFCQRPGPCHVMHCITTLCAGRPSRCRECAAQKRICIRNSYLLTGRSFVLLCFARDRTSADIAFIWLVLLRTSCPPAKLVKAGPGDVLDSNIQTLTFFGSCLLSIRPCFRLCGG